MATLAITIDLAEGPELTVDVAEGPTITLDFGLFSSISGSPIGLLLVWTYA